MVVNYSGYKIIIIRAISYKVTIKLLIGYNMLILISFLGYKLRFIII